MRRKLRSENRIQLVVQKRSHGGETILRFGFELLVGIGLELLRRTTKVWLDSIKTEARLHRQIPQIREVPPAALSASSSIQTPGISPMSKGRLSWKGLLRLLKAAALEWSRDKCPQLGAALAYYAVFSLAPLILLLLGLFGIVYGGNQQAREKILEQLSYFMDPNALQSVQEIAAKAAQPTPGLWAAFTGILIALFGASGIFGQLQDALNAIWDVKPKPKAGAWAFIRSRFLSFAMVGGVCFLLLISLTLEGVLKNLHAFLQGVMPGGHYVGLGVFYLFDLAIIVFLFAMIFRFLPDVKISWRDV